MDHTRQSIGGAKARYLRLFALHAKNGRRASFSTFRSHTRTAHRQRDSGLSSDSLLCSSGAHKELVGVELKDKIYNMSSVSFPTGVRPGSPSNSAQENFFGSSYNPSSSFQINPLSQHPPRTPRSSIVHVNQSQLYGSNIYTPASENGSISEKQPVEVEQFEEAVVPEDVEETLGKEAAEKVKSPEVWREVFKTSAGRDKAFVRYGDGSLSGQAAC